MNFIEYIPSSFRDHSGNLFFHKGSIYRLINYSYSDNYELFIKSGLYNDLVEKGFIVSFKEIEFNDFPIRNAYKILKPVKLDFISYPYEWCFSQLKHAALLTLEIQKIALSYGMSLKDASAYNIQFNKNSPIFIDTLSFERYHDGKPWVAYRQFCQNFLAPLALMSLKGIKLGRLFQIFLDGIPIDFTCSLLPKKSLFMFGILIHLHLHSMIQRRFEKQNTKLNKYKIHKHSLINIIESLKTTIKKLSLNQQNTAWIDYYDSCNYTERAMENKKDIIKEMISKFDPGIVLDLGANEGTFSRLIAKRAKQVISIDNDPACIEKNYLYCIKNNETNILPLVIDITNPSPSIGWQNKERTSFFERFKFDTVVALAIIHHIAISNNVPIDKIAYFLKDICRYLIIEFIPKTDKQLVKLMSSREDIFFNYNKNEFENVFSRYFVIKEVSNIVDSERTLYLMEKNFKICQN